MKRLLTSCLLLATGATGCANILGIEEARCDSQFSGCQGFVDPSAETEATDGTDAQDATDTDTDTEATDTATPTDAAEATDTGPVSTDVVTDEPIALTDETAVTDTVTDDTTGTDLELPDAAAETDTIDEVDASMPPPDAVADAGRDAAPPDAATLKSRLCAEYCALTQSNCSGDNEQHATEESCLEICKDMMVSEAETEPSSTDTVECRLAAAEDAEIAEPEFNCVVAGMTGGDVCGQPCPVFCDMMQRVCPDQFAEAFTNCDEECLELPRETDPFSLNMTSGNTLECRFNHLRLATDTQRPDVHCPHVAGNSPCAD